MICYCQLRRNVPGWPKSDVTWQTATYRRNVPQYHSIRTNVIRSTTQTANWALSSFLWMICTRREVASTAS